MQRDIHILEPSCALEYVSEVDTCTDVDRVTAIEDRQANEQMLHAFYAVFKAPLVEEWFSEALPQLDGDLHMEVREEEAGSFRADRFVEQQDPFLPLGEASRPAALENYWFIVIASKIHRRTLLWKLIWYVVFKYERIDHVSDLWR